MNQRRNAEVRPVLWLAAAVSLIAALGLAITSIAPG